MDNHKKWFNKFQKRSDDEVITRVERKDEEEEEKKRNGAQRVRNRSMQ